MQFGLFEFLALFLLLSQSRLQINVAIQYRYVLLIPITVYNMTMYYEQNNGEVYS